MEGKKKISVYISPLQEKRGERFMYERYKKKLREGRRIEEKNYDVEMTREM